MSEIKTKRRKYELVPPDGGWGYMICLGATLNVITVSTFVNCFGITFKELFIELDMDSTSVTLFNGINCFIIAFSGFMCSSLLKYISIRKLGLIAALILNIGVFGTVFAKSKFHFFFCQGFLQSLGHGIIFILTLTMITKYFVKRRLLAVSITQTVAAATNLGAPQLVKWAIEMYGSRGAALLISGVSMHSILAMTLMQPVEWHMKRVPVPEDKENEMELLLVNDKNYVINKNESTASKTSNKIDDAGKGSDRNIRTEELTAIAHSNGLMKFIHQNIDVSMLRSFLLSNACTGSALSVFSEMTFTLILPQALYFKAWSESAVAWAVTLNALGDLVTRILFIVMSSVLAKLGSDQIFVVGLVIAFLSRIGMLWSDNRNSIMAFITVMGMSRCTILVISPVVVADAVEQHKFSSAMGMHLLVFGCFNLILAPIIGAVRDLTDSYTTAFFILTSFIAIVILFWSIEMIYKNSKHKRQVKNDISVSLKP